VSKGSWRRPAQVSDAEVADRWARAFAQEKDADGAPSRGSAAPHVGGERFVALSLDELRAIVFKTSTAYAHALDKSVQVAEWERAAALANALQDLGFVREADMIGGAA
jgi:hypothetical protein